MEQLATNDIYKIWSKASSDSRYLRRNRWTEIARVVSRNKVNSVLEFGSGISTVLFDNMGLKVDSFETDKDYMKSIQEMCSDRVSFTWWDNKVAHISKFYDLALVDGSLPRMMQLNYAIKHADIVAIDDFVGAIRTSMLPIVEKFPRLDTGMTFMAIFLVD